MGTVHDQNGSNTVECKKDCADDQDEDVPLIVGEDKVVGQKNPTDDKPPTSPTSPDLNAGDSSRGIGVILVILYHMGYERFKNAWFCISLFFVLSGFIMTKNTVESFERRGHVDVYRFWAKRISRLFPALLLTIVLILLSQLLPIRQNDGVTFQREATDTWYATIFMTNYNLAYNQVDDYFDEFSAPSITRHLWTLSIEEQYYTIWPVVLLVITKTVVFMSKNCCTKIDQNENIYIISGAARNCVGAILILDLVVMAASYFSSLTTIAEFGTSAAYYSTMCRMGDIAAGGFSYSTIRLIPQLSRRWYRDPALPPLSFKMRVFLELMATSVLMVFILVPMIQTPVDEMLLLYFEKLRIFLSLLVFGFVANTIQMSEPLPKWAIASRILGFRPLVFLGVISYGIYVVHWPMLVYFGDPVGIGKKKAALGWEEPYDGVLGYEGRNVVLFVTVMVIGYLSFMYFEMPILFLSKVTMPKKTIATGFLSLFTTLMINLLVTKDLAPMMTLQNDQDAVNGLDHRFTPMLVATNIVGEAQHYFQMLDYHTRTVFYTQSMYHEEGFNWYDRIIKDYQSTEFADFDSFVIIACKNAVDRSPCGDPGIWNSNTHWLWLESSSQCGDAPIRNQVVSQERCEDVISTSEFTCNESDRTISTYTTLLSANDAFPGAINQDTMSRVESDYDLEMNGGNEAITNGWDPMKITMIGDSVAVRIGMFWKDSISLDMPDLDNDLFPALYLKNLATGGYPAISYFACLSTHPNYQYKQCKQFTKNTPSIVLDSFKSTKPNVVVVHDSHLANGEEISDEPEKMGLKTRFEQIMAFNIMIDEAVKAKVEHMIFLTLSRVFGKTFDAYYNEMDLVMKVVDVLACPKGDPSGMWLTVVDWAKFVCPTMDSEECPKSVHGFDDILPDNIHPLGDSGLWLTREALAMSLAEISKYSLPDEFGSYSTWDESIANPISANLLKLAPPDGEPTFEDLVSTYYVCPYKNLEKLETDYKKATPSFPARFQSYKDSAHFDVFNAEGSPAYVDLDDISNKEVSWYAKYGPYIKKQYDHRIILKGPDPSLPENNAVIDWAVNQTHIRLAVAAPAMGHLGFGIADSSGGFLGADMVFMETGNLDSLRDTYTTDEEKPQTDDCAGDWELVSSGIFPQGIGFETVRLLDTGDSQDKIIMNDSNPLAPSHKILVTWGDSETVDSIGENRGSGSVRFFEEEGEEPFHAIMDRVAEDSFAIQAANYEVADSETNYFLTCLTKNDMIARGLHKTGERMHVVGFEPIIQTKNSDFVHHYLVFGSLSNKCDGEFEELIYGWSNGMKSSALPDFLGLPFNGEHQFNSFKLQIHYNNPLLYSDIVDSSGVRLYWTSKLREQEMGIFSIGDPWVKKTGLLGEKMSKHDFNCPSSCTETHMTEPITVFSEIHHAHRLADQTVIDQFRDGKKIRSGKVEYFDWRSSGLTPVIQDPFIVEPGDALTMSCYYKDKDGTAHFGYDTKGEMCLGVFAYYPKVEKDNWSCGYKVTDSACVATYKRTKIPNVNALGRSFPFGDGDKCPQKL